MLPDTRHVRVLVCVCVYTSMQMYKYIDDFNADKPQREAQTQVKQQQLIPGHPKGHSKVTG